MQCSALQTLERTNFTLALWPSSSARVTNDDLRFFRSFYDVDKIPRERERERALELLHPRRDPIRLASEAGHLRFHFEPTDALTKYSLTGLFVPVDATTIAVSLTLQLSLSTQPIR